MDLYSNNKYIDLKLYSFKVRVQVSDDGDQAKLIRAKIDT